MTTSNSTSLVSRTVSGPKTPTWGRWVAVGIIAVLAAAITSVLVVSADDSTPRRTPTPAAVVRPPLLSPLPAAASAPTSAGVARVLAAGLRDPAFGGHVTADVIDPLSGQQLVDRDSSVSLPP